jgi:hypothetical protein
MSGPKLKKGKWREPAQWGQGTGERTTKEDAGHNASDSATRSDSASMLSMHDNSSDEEGFSSNQFGFVSPPPASAQSQSSFRSQRPLPTAQNRKKPMPNAPLESAQKVTPDIRTLGNQQISTPLPLARRQRSEFSLGSPSWSKRPSTML